MTKPFVLASEVKAGDILIADAGFTCLNSGSENIVRQDAQYILQPGEEFSGLYVECKEGKHYLGGQLGGPFGGFKTDDHLVGFWKK